MSSHEYQREAAIEDTERVLSRRYAKPRDLAQAWVNHRWLNEGKILVFGERVRSLEICDLEKWILERIGDRQLAIYSESGIPAQKRSSVSLAQGADWQDFMHVSVAQFRAVFDEMISDAKDATPQETIRERRSSTNNDNGVAKAEILAVFPPLRGQTYAQWERMLGDGRAKWLKEARVYAGGRGDQSRWNPAMVAMCLAEKGYVGRGTLGSLIRRNFPEYLDEWENYAGRSD